jgi:hypothetical protein
MRKRAEKKVHDKEQEHRSRLTTKKKMKRMHYQRMLAENGRLAQGVLQILLLRALKVDFVAALR